KTFSITLLEALAPKGLVPSDFKMFVETIVSHIKMVKKEFTSEVILSVMSKSPYKFFSPLYKELYLAIQSPSYISSINIYPNSELTVSMFSILSFSSLLTTLPTVKPCITNQIKKNVNVSNKDIIKTFFCVLSPPESDSINETLRVSISLRYFFEYSSSIIQPNIPQ